ncbi:ATP-dependent sacrificial sulfur transferase LarE [Legionella taurinensis]|uniref:ATP-dependent sacrificial sulfur transferase LarE n=1 Tax=Legionella taurinensis TaxID=70611 RepID=A0AB38N7Q6_9GAMM|nr:ATP-dependent sacrificial sulfur transferase LarE [Legionella taurinensis]MDX1837269.1 ATP-dependent sacrificial sulfur transferase LarE [Legionella taurinensis]PUT40259.1 ATP-dependent sacrificial sulfur transferase LarE [Legionella taurinensis]PUT41493.1 ATP-dependent sacrificial sulfur transferase LarE [Legionella taurinensis]PUT44359.1 ATP-dependent sacrificial sulfur transferase LarE [Legionella taurinensis]PUT48321.1 ATP-dependent sacrificial sulfur transferase LarE [Legionella taurin
MRETKAVMTYAGLLETATKMTALHRILTPLIEGGLMVAFSGGVDSSFLLWAAVEALNSSEALRKTGRVLAVLAVSPSIPAWEIDEAKQFAKAIEAALCVIDSQELAQDAYAKNDNKRCYYCKSELFALAKREARERGYRSIAYGYNASDRRDIRLGHVAAQENNIYSPLEAAGLEKAEIRGFLKQLGFHLSDKPASPCLASRLMTGVRVTEEKLNHVQTMEHLLRQEGFRVYRVRVHEEKGGDNSLGYRYFRIEVAPDEMLKLFEIRESLIHTARQLGYRWVNLDLAGYQLGGGTVLS